MVKKIILNVAEWLGSQEQDSNPASCQCSILPQTKTKQNKKEGVGSVF